MPYSLEIPDSSISFFILWTDLARLPFKRLDRIVRGKGFCTWIVCRDLQDSCYSDTFAVYTKFLSWETKGRTPRNNIISLCPNYFTLPLNDTDPCDKRELDLPIPGHPTLSAGLGLLHEFLHYSYLIGPEYDNLRDITDTAFLCHALVHPNKYDIPWDWYSRNVFGGRREPIWSVNSYIALAKWSWMMQEQKQKCPHAYPLWDVLEDDQPEEEAELRKLLGESGTSDFNMMNQTDVALGTFPNGISPPSNLTFDLHNTSGATYNEASGFDTSIIQFEPDADILVAGRNASATSSVEPSPSSTPSAEAHQCYGTCTEVARACAWSYLGECKCGAPRIGVDFWHKRSCLPVVSKPAPGLDRRDGPDFNISNSADGRTSATSSGYPQDAIYEISGYYYYALTKEQVACPCNATCVSYGCCASDGFIWEPRDSCMGKLGDYWGMHHGQCD